MFYVTEQNKSYATRVEVFQNYEAAQDPELDFMNASKEALAEIGVLQVEIELGTPKFDSATQDWRLGPVTLGDDQIPRASFAAVDLTPDEITKKSEATARAMRKIREKHLVETDHWAYSDTPDMTDEQIAYRQALRDITDQDGFPFNVTWPTKPE